MMPRRTLPPPVKPPTPTILVVEDEWITAQDIRETLSALGYRVSATVPSGAAALEAVAAERPDLALVDIRLEGAMDGIELAGRLRTAHALPVVYLTAHSDRDTIERLTRTLPHGYVSKPFDEGQLRVAVELALHSAALERQQLRARADDRSKLQELETRAAALEGRLREIAGLVSEPSAEPVPHVSPDLERRLRDLSRRETEIVRMLAEGRRVVAIARDLDLSIHTVRNHLRAIFRKLDVHSQEDLTDAVRGLPPGSLLFGR